MLGDSITEKQLFWKIFIFQSFFNACSWLQVQSKLFHHKKTLKTVLNSDKKSSKCIQVANIFFSFKCKNIKFTSDHLVSNLNCQVLN